MTDDSVHNPYRRPASPADTAARPRPSVSTIAVAFFLGLMAAVAAFFATCVGSLFFLLPLLGKLGMKGSRDYREIVWMLVLSALVAVAAAIWAAVKTSRWLSEYESVTEEITTSDKETPIQ